MTATDTDTLRSALIYGVLTGSTCGDGCWHAREAVCHCSCGGANHGILNRGGARPERTAKIGGEFYTLAAIIGREPGDCPADACRLVSAEVSRLLAERFPGIDPWQYGEWRPFKQLPVLDRKVSASQAKWPEVVAVPGAFRLVWARPAGTAYARKGQAE